MKFEFEGLLKEAFGVDKAKASDISNPGTPYTFQNTLEWAVGVQPKKEPSQVTQDTPLAKQFPQESIQEPGLVEPTLSPLDIIGTGIPTKLGKTALQEGMRQIETGTGLLGKLLPNPRTYIVKTEDNPTWSATSAKGFLENEDKMSDTLLWQKFKTYRGFDGILRQYDYDGNNSFHMNNIKVIALGIKSGMDSTKLKLSELLDSPNLYKSFPEFKDIPIKIVVKKDTSAYTKSSTQIDGSFINTPGNKKVKGFEIELEVPHDYLDAHSFDTFVQESLSTLHHELTHASQKSSKVLVSGGSNPEVEFLSKADYEDLLKIAPNLTADALKQEIKRIRYKNYYLSHGETEARGAQGALHLTEQEFNRTVPTTIQKADLKQKAKIVSDPTVNQSNVTSLNANERLVMEWGNSKNYDKALSNLFSKARKSNFPIEDIPFIDNREALKRNQLDPESLKRLIIPSLVGGSALLNEGEYRDLSSKESKIIESEKRKPK